MIIIQSLYFFSVLIFSRARAKLANNQLFRFIDVLGGNLQRDKNIHLIEPYDWQKLFTSFDKKLMQIQNTIDKHDKEIINLLEKMGPFIEKISILLEIFEKEYEIFYGKEKKNV